jgi:hypothetical protein
MVLASFKACPTVLTLEREAEETLHKAAVIRLATARYQAAGQAANTKRIRVGAGSKLDFSPEQN